MAIPFDLKPVIEKQQEEIMNFKSDPNRRPADLRKRPSKIA